MLVNGANSVKHALSIIWGTSHGRPCCAHSKGMVQIDMGVDSQTSRGHF